jgi:hypothetical protein
LGHGKGGFEMSDKTLNEILGHKEQTPMYAKDLDWKDYVYIYETGPPKLLRRYGNFGQSENGFYFMMPGAGLVKKDYWEALNKFQNNVITKEDEEWARLYANGDPKLFDNTPKPPFLEVWDRLREKHKSFYNTIEEFNVISEVDWEGIVQYRRASLMMGRPSWAEGPMDNWHDICKLIKERAK